DAKKPKFDRCASPQACTVIPVTGVVARSWAITAAAPRKKAKGDSAIRPIRTGTSPRIRPLFWLLRISSASRPMFSPVPRAERFPSSRSPSPRRRSSSISIIFLCPPHSSLLRKRNRQVPDDEGPPPREFEKHERGRVEEGKDHEHRREHRRLLHAPPVPPRQ